MLYQPRAQLPRHYRLARDWELPGPLPIDADPESPTLQEGKIDQFHFQPRPGQMISNDHTVTRFGTRHAPLYPHKLFSASLMLPPLVHAKALARAYRPRYNSR